MKQTTIFADFNNRDVDGCLRLNTVGSMADLATCSIRLEEGMELSVSDGDLIAKIVVRAPGLEGVWRGQIVSGPVEAGDG